MDGLLRSGARLRHSRYRRHLRCRARASAALALQRPLRSERCFLPIHVATPGARVPSRSCYAPARRRRASKCARICAGSFAISAGVGRKRGSPSGATATTPGPRRWNGARTTASITCSAFPARSRCRRKSTRAAEAGPHRARGVEQTSRARLCRNARHKAKSWNRERRAPSPASKPPRSGLDTRFVVTNVEYGAAKWVYDTLYCARGQAENLIKLHTRRSSLPIEPPAVPPSAAKVPPRSAHSGLLAHTHRSRRHPQTARSRQRRVLDLAAAADQDRSPRHRNRKPRPSRFRRRPAPEADLFRSLPGALSALGP